MAISVRHPASDTSHGYQHTVRGVRPYAHMMYPMRTVHGYQRQTPSIRYIPWVSAHGPRRQTLCAHDVSNAHGAWVSASDTRHQIHPMGISTRSAASDPMRT